MGFFTEGYKKGEGIQTGKVSPEEYNDVFKSILKENTYEECIEWINGFYKAMLDYDLASLKSAFMSLKGQAEGKERKENEL